MKHHEWMLITECRLHLAPIGLYPQRILDIGTGTGKLLRDPSLNYILISPRNMGYANRYFF
jgi:hypothetical protein